MDFLVHGITYCETLLPNHPFQTVGTFNCNWNQLQLGVNRIESFSVEKFAKMMDISQRTAYGLIASGLGPTFIRVGRHIRITQEDFEKWIETKRSNK